MNYDLIINKIDETYVHVTGNPGVKIELKEALTFEVPNSKFMKGKKGNRRMVNWDGKISLLNLLTGRVYAGLVPFIQKFADDKGYSIHVDEEITTKTDISEEDVENLFDEHLTNEKIVPRDYQIRAVHKALQNNRQLILSPTSSGKSLIIYIISKYHQLHDRKILLIVPTIGLVKQMESDFLDYNPDHGMTVHTITAGKEKTSTADVTISTWQSIFRQDESFFQAFDVVIGDEAHGHAAKSIVSIMENLTNAKYRYGTTGTLQGEKANMLVIEGLTGEIYQAIKTKQLMDRGQAAQLNINVLILNHNEQNCKAINQKDYRKEIDWLVSYPKRNKYITSLASNLKGNTLVLFQYVDLQGNDLYKMISEACPNKTVHYVAGSTDIDTREEIRLEVTDSTDNIIVASYGVFKAGVNIKSLDNLIFASPLKSRITNLQSIGRILRLNDGKTKATLYDIGDNLKVGKRTNFALRHMFQRLEIYKEEQFNYKVYQIDF